MEKEWRERKLVEDLIPDPNETNVSRWNGRCEKEVSKIEDDSTKKKQRSNAIEGIDDEEKGREIDLKGRWR